MKRLNLFLTAIAMLYGTQNLPAMNQANIFFTNSISQNTVSRDINVLYYPDNIPEPLAAEKQNTYNFFNYNNYKCI
jgi:hypothetical protein